MNSKNTTLRRMSGVLAFGAVAATVGTALPGTADARIAEPVAPLIADCEAGSGELEQGRADEPVYRADCRNSSPSAIAMTVDQVMKILAPDLGVQMRNFNKAVVVPGAYEGTSAKIEGNGFNAALAMTGGNASSWGDHHSLSSALSLATMQGDAMARSGFLGTATAFADGAGSIATAKALPGGVALVVSTQGHNASALAFGGVAMSSDIEEQAHTVCNAVYGKAAIADDEGNVSSCSSVLFILQKSQDGAGPVVYAIKNPFSVQLDALFGTNSLEIVPAILKNLGVNDVVADHVGGGLVPEYTRDLVRVTLTDDGPKLGTDLGWRIRDHRHPLPPNLPGVPTPGSDGLGPNLPGVPTPGSDGLGQNLPGVPTPVSDDEGDGDEGDGGEMTIQPVGEPVVVDGSARSADKAGELAQGVAGPIDTDPAPLEVSIK